MDVLSQLDLRTLLSCMVSTSIRLMVMPLLRMTRSMLITRSKLLPLRATNLTFVPPLGKGKQRSSTLSLYRPKSTPLPWRCHPTHLLSPLALTPTTGKIGVSLAYTAGVVPMPNTYKWGETSLGRTHSMGLVSLLICPRMAGQWLWELINPRLERVDTCRCTRLMRQPLNGSSLDIALINFLKMLAMWEERLKFLMMGQLLHFLATTWRRRKITYMAIHLSELSSTSMANGRKKAMT
mmetsp:Transcript_27184/g.44133  ORF Transcript_27184/g.44133 Transcript_27184/m.44133 type:complete len:237 (+) Transcript_27184:1416-2126(+)